MEHKSEMRILAAILGVVLCFLALTTPSQASTGIVKASALRVRAEPGGAITDRLLQGTTVNILGTNEIETNGQQSVWYQIDYLKDGARKSGYASADWIVPTGGSAATAIESAAPPVPSVAPAGAAPVQAAPAPAVPPSWFATVHAKDPNSQEWTSLKTFWVKRYTEDTFKYVTEATSLAPNLEPAEISAHLETFLLDAGTEMAWARNHANTYRSKGLDLSTPLTEKGDYVSRSLMADDLAITLQLYATAVKLAQNSVKTKMK